jgi:hypothetical protein
MALQALIGMGKIAVLSIIASSLLYQLMSGIDAAGTAKFTQMFIVLVAVGAVIRPATPLPSWLVLAIWAVGISCTSAILINAFNAL